MPFAFIDALADCSPMQVYQVVCKIVDEQAEKDQIRLSAPVIYDSIKRSNSSLNRKPKKLLEDSLERVLEVLKADAFGEDDERDPVQGDFEGLAEEPPPVRNSFFPSAARDTDYVRSQMVSTGAL